MEFHALEEHGDEIVESLECHGDGGNHRQSGYTNETHYHH